MRAVFIRHGESTGNAGVPCHDLATIELTERSRGQARHVAASWDKAPSLIVTPPYAHTSNAIGARRTRPITTGKERRASMRWAPPFTGYFSGDGTVTVRILAPTPKPIHSVNPPIHNSQIIN